MYDNKNANDILEDKRIKSLSHRVILRKIILFANRPEGCTAGNEIFTEMYGVGVNSVVDAHKIGNELDIIFTEGKGGKRVSHLVKNKSNLLKSKSLEALEKQKESLIIQIRALEKQKMSFENQKYINGGLKKDKGKTKERLKSGEEEILENPINGGGGKLPPKKVPPKKGAEMEKAWNDWKEYTEIQFNFSYRHKKSEDLAKQLLWEMSGGNTKKAIKIINHTMANGWKGFVSPNEKKKPEYTPPLRTANRKDFKPVSRETKAKGLQLLKSINLGKRTDDKAEKTDTTFNVFLEKWKRNAGYEPNEKKLRELKEYYFNKRQSA